MWYSAEGTSGLQERIRGKGVTEVGNNVRLALFRGRMQDIGTFLFSGVCIYFSQNSWYMNPVQKMFGVDVGKQYWIS